MGSSGAKSTLAHVLLECPPLPVLSISFARHIPRRAVAQAELAAADLKAREEVASGVGGMSLTAEQQQQQQQQQQQYLLDNLDKWESFAGGAAATAAAGAAKAPPRLYNAPYEYGAIAVRPIMLDTASNCLAYPSLEHRLRKPEKKSVLSSLFSWRR